MTTGNVAFRQIWDQRDDEEIRQMIVRVANRLHHFSGPDLHIMLANPLAMQMIIGYLNGLFLELCARDGIDISQMPALDGEGYDINLELKRRH